MVRSAELKLLFGLTAVIVALVCGAWTSSEVNASTKWTEYTDPYGRYTIEYPSKWQVEDEPVHSLTNEIPLQISIFDDGAPAETLSVQEFHEEDGLNAREILSLFKNSLDQTFLSTKSARAFECGVTSYAGTQTCTGGFVVSLDGLSWSPIFARSIVKEDKTFVVAYHVLSLSNELSTEDLHYMVDSFTLLTNGNLQNSQFPSTKEVTSGEDAEQSSSSTDIQFRTYDSPNHGFSIQYPENWKTTEDTSGVWFASPVNEIGSLRIESEPAQGLSLDKLVQLQLSQSMKSTSEFTIKSSKITTLAGNSANETHYTFMNSDTPLYFTGTKISAIIDDKVYTITYFARSDDFYSFSRTFQQMVNSANVL